MACHRINVSPVHGCFAKLQDKYQTMFKFFCVGMFGIIFNILHEQKLKELDNANADVLTIM